MNALALLLAGFALLTPLSAGISINGTALQASVITLPVGNHSFSNLDVEAPLLIRGHSSETTILRCAGECATIRVSSSLLVLESLMLVGCGCDALDVEGGAELRNVELAGSFYCGGNLNLTHVNASDGIVDGGCALRWQGGRMYGNLLIAGADSRTNIENVTLADVHIVAGKDATVEMRKSSAGTVLFEDATEATLRYERNASFAARVDAKKRPPKPFDWNCPFLPTAPRIQQKMPVATFAAGEDTAYKIACDVDGYFEAVGIIFGTKAKNGSLWRIGGDGQGSWLGIRDDVFRLRAGNGGKEFPSGFNGTDSDVAVLDIPLSKLNHLFDDQPHNISWHIAIAGAVTLWVDGEKVGQAYSSGYLQLYSFCGVNTGGLLTHLTILNPHAGEPTHRIPLALFGHLRYFNYRCPRTTPQGFAHVTFMDSTYELLATPKTNKVAVGYVGESCDMVCAASGRLCDSSTLQSLDSTAALQSVIDFECSFVEGTATDENKNYQILSPYLDTRHNQCISFAGKTVQPSCSLQVIDCLRRICPN